MRNPPFDPDDSTVSHNPLLYDLKVWLTLRKGWFRHARDKADEILFWTTAHRIRLASAAHASYSEHGIADPAFGGLSKLEIECLRIEVFPQIKIIDDTLYLVDDAYKQGVWAFQAGTSWHSNPYRPGSQRHDQWSAGHEHASEN